jgi:hypothetical protein
MNKVLNKVLAKNSKNPSENKTICSLGYGGPDSEDGLRTDGGSGFKVRWSLLDRAEHPAIVIGFLTLFASFSPYTK